jgi:uncharacterized membrane protein
VFAERVTAFGEWKFSSVEHAKGNEVQQRFHSMDELFATPDINKAIEIIGKYGIDYIYVGSVERKLYRGGIEKFQGPMFIPVYTSGDITILKVNYV